MMKSYILCNKHILSITEIYIQLYMSLLHESEKCISTENKFALAILLFQTQFFNKHYKREQKCELMNRKGLGM